MPGKFSFKKISFNMNFLFIFVISLEFSFVGSYNHFNYNPHQHHPQQQYSPPPPSPPSHHHHHHQEYEDHHHHHQQQQYNHHQSHNRPYEIPSPRRCSTKLETALENMLRRNQMKSGSRTHLDLTPYSVFHSLYSSTSNSENLNIKDKDKNDERRKTDNNNNNDHHRYMTNLNEKLDLFYNPKKYQYQDEYGENHNYPEYPGESNIRRGNRYQGGGGGGSSATPSTSASSSSFPMITKVEVADLRVRLPNDKRWVQVDKCQFTSMNHTLDTRLLFPDLTISGKVILHPSRGQCNMILRLRRAGIEFRTIPLHQSSSMGPSSSSSSFPISSSGNGGSDQTRRRNGGIATVRTDSHFAEPGFLSVFAHGCQGPSGIKFRQNSKRRVFNSRDGNRAAEDRIDDNADYYYGTNNYGNYRNTKRNHFPNSLNNNNYYRSDDDNLDLYHPYKDDYFHESDLYNHHPEKTSYYGPIGNHFNYPSRNRRSDILEKQQQPQQPHQQQNENNNDDNNSNENDIINFNDNTFDFLKYSNDNNNNNNNNNHDVDNENESSHRYSRTFGNFFSSFGNNNYDSSSYSYNNNNNNNRYKRPYPNKWYNAESPSDSGGPIANNNGQSSSISDAEEISAALSLELEQLFSMGVRGLLTTYMQKALQPAIKETLMENMGYTLSYG